MSVGPTRLDRGLPTPRRWRRAALAAGLGGAVLLTTAACSEQQIDELERGGMPVPATEQAPTILTLWQWSWVAALLVGALVWALILIAVVIYRRKAGDPVPEQTRYNIPIEVLYTVAPLIMIMTLFYFTARDQAELTAVKDDQDLTVGVVGFKWNWGFNYLDDDVFTVGTPNRPAELVLPVDKKVRFELTSPDVIHSFWVPAFLFKMDVIPGRLNQFEVTPNKLGTFAGKCAELCGVDHSRMLFNVRVVTQAEYDAYVAKQKAEGFTGLLDTGRSSVAAGTSTQSGTQRGIDEGASK